MADAVTLVKGAVSVGKALIAAGRWAGRGALQDAFDEAERRDSREVGQVCYAVCKALVAHAFGRPAEADEVEAFLASGVNDPAFPARAHRLLGEIRKTASSKRRRMLAAILLGRRLANTIEDDQERIDMLVERLVSTDIELLGLIRKFARPRPVEMEPPSECAIVYFEGLHILPFGHLQGVAFEDMGSIGLSGDGVRDQPEVSPAALNTLLTMGCIEMPDGLTRETTVSFTTAKYGIVGVTALGHLLLDALDAIRPAFEEADSNKRA